MPKRFAWTMLHLMAEPGKTKRPTRNMGVFSIYWLYTTPPKKSCWLALDCTDWFEPGL